MKKMLVNLCKKIVRFFHPHVTDITMARIECFFMGHTKSRVTADECRAQGVVVNDRQPYFRQDMILHWKCSRCGHFHKFEPITYDYM
jgi:hypothetical protein